MSVEVLQAVYGPNRTRTTEARRGNDSWIFYIMQRVFNALTTRLQTLYVLLCYGQFSLDLASQRFVRIVRIKDLQHISSTISYTGLKHKTLRYISKCTLQRVHQPGT